MLFGDTALENGASKQASDACRGQLVSAICTPETAALADCDHSNNNVSLVAKLQGCFASIHATGALVLHQECRQLSTPNSYIKCGLVQMSCG